MKATKVRHDKRAKYYFDVQYEPELSKENYHRLFNEKLRWRGSVLSIDPEKIKDIRDGQVRISGHGGVQGIHDEFLKLYPSVEIVEEL